MDVQCCLLSAMLDMLSPKMTIMDSNFEEMYGIEFCEVIIVYYAIPRSCSNYILHFLFRFVHTHVPILIRNQFVDAHHVLWRDLSRTKSLALSLPYDRLLNIQG